MIGRVAWPVAEKVEHAVEEVAWSGSPGPLGDPTEGRARGALQDADVHAEPMYLPIPHIEILLVEENYAPLRRVGADPRHDMDGSLLIG